ncbi:MAG TPA: hypothetical protein VG496_08055, partial [Myxococcales bacterium]|nr:hypothetical protein [Myxococcales bacterium]
MRQGSWRFVGVVAFAVAVACAKPEQTAISSPDAGPIDNGDGGGLPDAGPPDAGPPDAGPAFGGPGPWPKDNV